jgi:mannose-6-phosphate isomerase-like protein (cupin superfamily)
MNNHLLSKLSLEASFSSFSQLWNPKLVASINNTEIKIAKVYGSFIWHKHPDTDELFYVFDGGPLKLSLRIRGQSDGIEEMTILLEKGELFVVPKGVEHLPSAENVTSIMMVEACGTANTGDVENRLVHEIIVNLSTPLMNGSVMTKEPEDIRK